MGTFDTKIPRSELMAERHFYESQISATTAPRHWPARLPWLHGAPT